MLLPFFFLPFFFTFIFNFLSPSLSLNDTPLRSPCIQIRDLLLLSLDILSRFFTSLCLALSGKRSLSKVRHNFLNRIRRSPNNPAFRAPKAACLSPSLFLSFSLLLSILSVFWFCNALRNSARSKSPRLDRGGR